MNRKSVRILIVDDEEIVRESFSGWLRKDGYTVETACDGEEAIRRLSEPGWSAFVVDLKMPGVDGLQVLDAARRTAPDTAVVIMTAYATVDTAVKAMKSGAYDYLTKPFDPEELSLMLAKVVEQQSLRRENRILRKVLRREWRFRDLVSKSPAMRHIFDLAKAAAKSRSTVLILGESGTGKELLARAIHAESDRERASFVPVSCAALTETLLESELFGHERGAFTGAVATHAGKFEAARGGTLFLDEIGDVGPKLQLDLLRVLEERRVVRVGGTDPIAIDVRVIAATNRDLRRAVDSGAFRQDLFYRLNVIPITLPPLRERREDVPILVDRFLEVLSVELGKRVEGLTADAMARLLAHDWPGNVRELRNALERAAVVCPGAWIEADHLGLPPLGSQPGASSPSSLQEVERRHIESVLHQTGGNVMQAARILEIDRATLYSKIRRFGLMRRDEAEAAPRP